jgi:transposase
VTRILCGVDVSSTSLDAAIGRTGTPQRFANTPRRHRPAGRFCHAHQVDLVALEATGGYERQAFALLTEQHGLPVAILNPRAVRQFAQSMGRLEKTDALDAAMIAWFAEVHHAQPSTLAQPGQQHLRALVTRLRQLTDLRTAQKNQQRLITDPLVQASFTELLALLNRQIKALAASIAERIAADPLWRQLDQAFRTIQGVADRHEPDFIAFRERLASAGKPPKVVRIALAHKLLVRLHAKARQIRQRLPSAAAPQPAFPITHLPLDSPDSR